MLEKWTGEVVGTAHLYKVTMGELAEEVGISRGLLSSYLNGKRKSPSAEPRIRKALMAIIERKELPNESEDIG